MNHWRYCCKGASHTIQIYTDHHNLQYFNTMERISGCLAYWSLQLQRFNYEIHYHPGKKNPADVPSRWPDYYLNNNDPNKPAQFHLSFHTMYPEHHREDMNLRLNAMTLPRSLHQEITNENARDTYLSTIKAKTNPEEWSTGNGTWKYKEKTYIPEALYMQIISQNHNKSPVGYFGRDRTLDLTHR